VVADRLGHANTGITMAIYSHVTAGLQEGAAAAFGRAMDRLGAPETPEE
jgi:integrase